MLFHWNYEFFPSRVRQRSHFDAIHDSKCSLRKKHLSQCQIEILFSPDKAPPHAKQRLENDGAPSHSENAGFPGKNRPCYDKPHPVFR